MSDPVIPFAPARDFARKSRFTVEDFDTLRPGALQWRVKGLWPSVGVCFVGGPSMSGKSFWVLDALAKVCRGEDVLGRKSSAAGVLYIASEGAHGVKNRIAGLRSRIGGLGGAFKFIGQAPDLRDADDIADLRAVIIEQQAEMTARGERLGVVAVDTLSASIPGADENSAADMSPVLHALQATASELGLMVLVVAHTGKDETRGLRGWSGLLANADGLIMLESPEGETRVGNVVKVKDGRSGDRFAFSLEVVEVGIDEDGDAITTCVIQPEDAPTRAKAGRRSTVAQTDAALIKQAINRLMPDKAVKIMAPGANGAMGLALIDLQNEAFRIGLGPTEPDTADLDANEAKRVVKAWRDHRGKAWNRALAELKGGGGYRIENDCIWETYGNKGESR